MKKCKPFGLSPSKKYAFDTEFVCCLCFFDTLQAEYKSILFSKTYKRHSVLSKPKEQCCVCTFYKKVLQNCFLKEAMYTLKLALIYRHFLSFIFFSILENISPLFSSKLVSAGCLVNCFNKYDFVF